MYLCLGILYLIALLRLFDLNIHIKTIRKIKLVWCFNTLLNSPTGFTLIQVMFTRPPPTIPYCWFHFKCAIDCELLI